MRDEKHVVVELVLFLGRVLLKLDHHLLESSVMLNELALIQVRVTLYSVLVGLKDLLKCLVLITLLLLLLAVCHGLRLGDLHVLSPLLA